MTLSAGVALGSAGIGALGSIGSALVGGFANAMSAEQQYNYQRDLMKYQAQLNYKYGKKSAENQYMWQRKGLENANFNPQLAYLGAGGVANTGWTSAQSGPAPDYNTPIQNATGIFNQWQQLQMNRANISNINSQTELNGALQDKALSEVSLNNADTVLRQTQWETQRIVNQLGQKNLDWYDKEHLAYLLHKYADIRYMNIKGMADLSNATSYRTQVVNANKLINGQIEYLKKNGQLTKEQAEYIQKQTEYLPLNARLKVADTIIQGIIGIGGLAIGGYAAVGAAGLNSLKGQQIKQQMAPSNAYQGTNIGF